MFFSLLISPLYQSLRKPVLCLGRLFIKLVFVLVNVRANPIFYVIVWLLIVSFKNRIGGKHEYECIKTIVSHNFHIIFKRYFSRWYDFIRTISCFRQHRLSIAINFNISKIKLKWIQIFSINLQNSETSQIYAFYLKCISSAVDSF